MDIQIITTKEKLTKSIVNQMFSLNPSKMRFATPIGYVNLGGKIGKRLLVKYESDYYLINPNWKLRGTCKGCRPYWGYKLGHSEMTKRFKNNQDAIDYYKDYKKLAGLCDKNGHIYLK